MTPERENRQLPAPISKEPVSKELVPETTGITALLPQYYEKTGEGITYEIVESFDVEGHEVAWLEFTGQVVFDITGQGNEGKEFRGRDLKCQCEFTENVGWKIEDGHKLGLNTKCDAKEKVIEHRHAQLRESYTERFKDDEKPDLKDHLEEIVFDLIQKRKDGEFLESSSGADFYGGYFYLQTLKSVSDTEWRDVHLAVGRMMHEKKIDLEGFVVQEYKVPPPPIWDEYTSLELDGYKATAFIPTHTKMEQSWAIQLTSPEGELLEPNLGPRLGHIPTFGPDIDDVEEVHEALKKILDGAKNSLPSKRPLLEIAPNIEE